MYERGTLINGSQKNKSWTPGRASPSKLLTRPGLNANQDDIKNEKKGGKVNLDNAKKLNWKNCARFLFFAWNVGWWTKHLDGEQNTKAKFWRRTSHEPNRMQMRKIFCSPSFAFFSAHVKYGVWTWPKGAFLWGDPSSDQWSRICLDHAASKEPANPLWSWIDEPWSRQILDHWSELGSPQRNAP